MSEKPTYKFSDEKLFWIKILISTILGILSYYLLEFVLLNISYFIDLPALNTLRDLLIIGLIYIITLFGVPCLILTIKEDHIIWISFKRSVKGFGLQFTLFILLSTITYFVNIW
ncbi:MAG: hypothetical protein ACTSPY_03515 [Candidatus Helarchaeota archaeon]